MLCRIFASYRVNYLGSEPGVSSRRLLPAETEGLVGGLPGTDIHTRARLICDHISGMSDDFAVRTYQRMFEAGFGSIVDLV